LLVKHKNNPSNKGKNCQEKPENRNKVWPSAVVVPTITMYDKRIEEHEKHEDSHRVEYFVKKLSHEDISLVGEGGREYYSWAATTTSSTFSKATSGLSPMAR